jgi:hypothetical protein
VAGIGPSVKAAGFPAMLTALAVVATLSLLAISFLPNEKDVIASTALKPAE